MCFEKFRKIHRKTPAPESLFNNVIVPELAILLNKKL